jgi:hypothetical protein
VLRDLIGDLRLAGHQHFAFHEYKDPHGNRLFAGGANGSVSFQLAQIKIGIDKVPVFIVMYTDGTFLKKGIPIDLYTVSISVDQAVAQKEGARIQGTWRSWR